MVAQFSLRQLEFFVEAARRGTISAAAKSCHTSQTAVSLAISDLERHLRTKLLIRRKAKGVVLTEAGSTILPTAREMLGLAERLREEARRSEGIVEGAVRFGCASTLSAGVLPTLLAVARDRHPELHLELVEGSPDRLIGDLAAGDCDVAMFFSRRRVTDLNVAVIGRYRPYVLVSKNHRLANRRSVRLSELADEPLITPMSSENFYDSEDVLRRAGIEPKVGMRCGNPATIRAMVARGDGFAIFVHPPAMSEPGQMNQLVTIAIEDDVPSASLYLATRREALPAMRIRAVWDICAELYGDVSDRSASSSTHTASAVQ